MRICSPQLGLSPEATLGGEVYDREILSRIAGMGAQVHVLLPAGLACVEAPGLAVTRIPLRRGYRWFVSNPVFFAALGQTYRRTPFDLLRVHSLRFTGPAALTARAALRMHVPIVAHHHHIDWDRWSKVIDAPVARHCDMIITGSRYSQRELVTIFGVPAERIRVVHYGVPALLRPQPRDEMLARRIGASDKRVIFYLGSLSVRKNLTVLLEAFAQVHAHSPDTLLILAGQGPLRASLQAKAIELGVSEAVIFPGSIPEAEKLNWYNLADIFVHPSRLEGFGLVAAEAMACGKAVVASRAGALPEVVVDGETGLLFDPDDPMELAHCIEQLLANETLRERMGRAGRERVLQHFQWEASARQVLAIYKDLVETWAG